MEEMHSVHPRDNAVHLERQIEIENDIILVDQTFSDL